MSEIVNRMNDFVKYAKQLGDEKGEAQVFCDRLFRAFGHEGYKEAGATLEARQPKAKGKGKGKKFIDLLWKPHVLIEMKSAHEKLHLHYQQAFEYWLQAVPNRPRYVVLCNFKEFWVYDFNIQMGEPVDIVALEELPKRYPTLNFLFPKNPKPKFGYDRAKVSRAAADKMAELFRGLIRHPNAVPRDRAQRFVLQLVVAMFAEDIDLMPAATIRSIYDDCVEKGQSPYDLFGSLLRQMNDPRAAEAGRFKGVRYFNGGLFSKVEPIELNQFQLDLIGKDNEGASTTDWSRVNPAIFGTLFQESMDAVQRHEFGAHYTFEADIQRIVGPTIVRPWRTRIDNAKSMKALSALRRELASFKVLDPSCGSGNFLYVAFREMSRIDLRILQRMNEIVTPENFAKQALTIISPRQFYGIELEGFGVELAKVTLMLAKKLALDEARETLGSLQVAMNLSGDALPLDNLDENIVQGDALLMDWPKVDAIVGNPPYQSKNKLQVEKGVQYLNELRDRYPEVDGRSDYCVYWFRLAHDNLKSGQRAGLVGTNTIRQNYSREASLDYIVQNEGTITEAMSSMPWPGQAAVHVSIVNWIKGVENGEKHLFNQEHGEDEKVVTLRHIGPSLSSSYDVTTAKRINLNAENGCYQGQTHGHKGFLENANSAKLAISADKTGKLGGVLKPFMIANDLIASKRPSPGRYVIDFHGLDVVEAESFKDQFTKIRTRVLPARKKATEEEKKRNQRALAKVPGSKVNRHHAKFLKHWWILSYPREAMVREITALPRYIVCGCVTKRPIFEFLSSSIRPNAALQVFAFKDDYSFGILQSNVHWAWFVARCSTLGPTFRYTSNTVWDSFPWPQKPTLQQVRKVAEAGIKLRELRRKLMEKHNRSFRELYRLMEDPGAHPLKAAHQELDTAVRSAYGMSPEADVLKYLLKLNKKVVRTEAKGDFIQAPGLPTIVKDASSFVTDDAIQP